MLKIINYPGNESYVVKQMNEKNSYHNIPHNPYGPAIFTFRYREYCLDDFRICFKENNPTAYKKFRAVCINKFEIWKV